MIIVSNGTSILSAALHYAASGFRVFPLHGSINGYCSCGKPPGDGHKPGKHPATPHGCRDGTTDAEIIKRWWTEKPWANVGIALDARHLGLDIDPDKGGRASLAAWQAQHGALPLTPRVRTGSGGDHWYFALPPGMVVKNRAGVAAGIDTRSLGGYLVAPPSRHQSGGHYEWLTPPDMPLATAPDWLLRIVAERPAPTSNGGGDAFVFSSNIEPDDFAGHPGEVSGKRNDTLCRLTGVHLARGDSLKSIEAMAVAWGLRCVPPCSAESVLSRVRALAKADAARRGVGPDSRGRGVGMEASGESPGKEGINSGVGQGDGVNSFPLFLPKAEGENAGGESPGKEGINSGVGQGELIPSLRSFPTPDATGESPSKPPNPYSLSTPFDKCDDENVYLTKNTVANQPPPTPPEGEREGYAFSSETELKAGGEGYSFGLVAKAEGMGGDRIGGEGEGPGVYSCDTASVGAQDDWPTLGADAYHGLAGRIVRAIAPETEADPVAILLSLLAAFGSAVGSNPRFSMLDGDHYANIYAAIVGGTASGKGRSAKIVRRLMTMADRDWEREAIASSLSSGEGFISLVKDDEEALPPEQGAFGFHMPEAKRLLVIESELARTYEAMGRQGNTLSGSLRSAWDHDILEVNTRGKSKLRASNAHVSIIVHCTPEELAKLMGGSMELVNGFSNRFLWALAKRSNILPRGGDIRVIEPFGEPLRVAVAKAKGIGQMTWDDKAGSLWDSEYEALTAEKPGAYGSATQRAHAQSLRLSMLYALIDGSAIIKIEHLRAALSVWRYCEHSARVIFGGRGQGRGEDSGRGVGVGSSPEPLDMRLLNSIIKAPGIGRTALLRAFRAQTGEAIGEALASLEARGLAHARMVKPEGGGRPGECWYPGPKPDGPDGNERKEGINSPFVFSMADESGAAIDANADGNERKEGINSPPPVAGVNSFLPEGGGREPGGEAPRNPPTLPPLSSRETSPTDTTVEAEAQTREDDEMGMQDFESMLKLHGLTLEDARNHARLTPRQRADVKHAQDYARNRAQVRKREREMRANWIPEDEFLACLDHPDFPGIDIDEVLRQFREGRIISKYDHAKEDKDLSPAVMAGTLADQITTA